MPVFKKPLLPVPTWDDLKVCLQAGIDSPSDDPTAPVIYEDQVQGTQGINVLVIWDRFAEVPQEQRGTLILEAYAASDYATTGKIRFAIGVTRDEAIRGGYLPYKVEPTIRSSDKINSEDVRQAMIENGAWVTKTGIQLRFPYRWLAEQALQRLQDRFGEASFCLAEEMGSVGQWART